MAKLSLTRERQRINRFVLKLSALDTARALPTRATKQELLTAMRGHVLAEASLMGTYQRCR